MGHHTAHFSQLHFFLQEKLINIKTRHFQRPINHQEHLFHKTHITSYFRPVNIEKILRTVFSQNTTRSSCLQMFFKIDAPNGFTNFTEKHLRQSFFLKNSQVEDLQLFLKKDSNNGCSLVKFAKFLKTPFFTEHLR